MDNLMIYNALRTPPPEALKEIRGGRLNGKTDINTMWRIKALTQQFGACGAGWYIGNTTVTYHPAGDEIICVVELDLYTRTESGEWSAPIHGIGGNKILSQERSGAYADDDGMKKAYSDAIGTACKALGMAADVYWNKDPSKYDARVPDEQNKGARSATSARNGEAMKRVPSTRSGEGEATVCQCCGKPIEGIRTKTKTLTAVDVENLSQAKYGKALCMACAKEAETEMAQEAESESA